MGYAAGSLDTTFGDDGVAAGFGVNAVALQPNGKIVSAGTTSGLYALYDDDFEVARYNRDGSFDTSFGDDGMVATRFSDLYGSKNQDQDDGANAIAVQADGKLIVAGYGSPDTLSPDNAFALARYDSDGSLDPSFGGDGLVLTAVSPSSSFASDLAIQDSGRIVVAGSRFDGYAVETVVARYRPNGTLDTTFHHDGIATVHFGTGLREYLDRAVALQPDGKILVAATGYDTHYTFAVARYNRDGSLDRTFHHDGKLTTAIGGDAWAQCMLVQPDGKILVAGGSVAGFALVRYNRDGTLDSSFDRDGRVTTAIGTTEIGPTPFDHPRAATASDIALQPDGKIVAAGGSYNGADVEFTIVRYNRDGSLDTTFDDDGKLVVPLVSVFGATTGGGASALAIQDDGNIVVVGTIDDGLGSPVVVRLHGGGWDLVGTRRSDTLEGSSGDDTVRGGFGSDDLDGRLGEDALTGGSGSDTVLGGGGNDFIVGGRTDENSYLGGSGVDTVSYAARTAGITVHLGAGTASGTETGSDALSGIENVIAGRASDTVVGSRRNNSLEGNAGNDVLAGGGGDDVLHGGAGNDTLKGGRGDDILAGGIGHDRLVGGAGADQFDFNVLLNDTNNVDQITDFDVDADLIRLDQTIFSSLALGDLPATAFYGGPGITAAHDESDRIIYDSDTGNLYYDADGNGADAAKLIAVLSTLSGLAASDILIV